MEKRSPRDQKFSLRVGRDGASSREKCYFCELNLRVVLAVCAALQVDFSSDQKEQQADDAQQHDGLLGDGRQTVCFQGNMSLSVLQPLQNKNAKEESDSSTSVVAGLIALALGLRARCDPSEMFTSPPLII